MFAVLPLLAPWRGDPRRNPAPYFISRGISYSCIAECQHIKRELERRGIACFVDVIDPD